MKKTIIISALGAMFMASCADEFNTNNYVVDRPAKTEAYAYLNDYQPLKNYVDRTKYPNFKLGIGTTASDYLKKRRDRARQCHEDGIVCQQRQWRYELRHSH